MKLTITALLFNIISLSNMAKNTTNRKKISKNIYYIKKTSETTGKTTVFAQIIINASPELVRAKFLDFKKWNEWNTVFPKIKVKKGNLNELTTKLTLDLVRNFGRKHAPAPAQTNPKVYENSPKGFY